MLAAGKGFSMAKRPNKHGGVSLHRGSGRWQARLTVDGRRVTRYAATAGEAWKLLEDLRRRAAAGLDMRADRVTVAEYLAGWLENSAALGKVRERTLEGYAQHVRDHLTPALGRLTLTALPRPATSTITPTLTMTPTETGTLAPATATLTPSPTRTRTTTPSPSTTATIDPVAATVTALWPTATPDVEATLTALAPTPDRVATAVWATLRAPGAAATRAAGRRRLWFPLLIRDQAATPEPSPSLTPEPTMPLDCETFPWMCPAATLAARRTVEAATRTAFALTAEATMTPRTATPVWPGYRLPVLRRVR